MDDALQIGKQRAGEIFSWPTGWRLTALQDAILAIPVSIVSHDEIIGSVIHCDDEVRLNFPEGPPSELSPQILIWLKEGQSVYLTKSCQAMVLPSYEGDKAVRRFALSRVED